MRDEILAGDYDEVVFDVFGVSRGAVLAWHFVNLSRTNPDHALPDSLRVALHSWQPSGRLAGNVP